MKICQISLLFLLLLLANHQIGLSAEKWKLTGNVYCLDQKRKWIPIEGAKIELWEFDRWPDKDDLLGKSKTDIDGKFSVSGEEDEIMATEPYLVVRHDCDDPKKPLEKANCHYKTEITLSPRPEQQYINMGMGDMAYAFSKSDSTIGNEPLTMKTEVYCED